jgi:GWxTD domain-containing protein
MRPSGRRRLARAWLLAALWLGPASVAAQSIDEHFEPIPTPPAAGAYPPAVQEAIDEGYGHLARAEGPADEAALEAAKAAFERAIGLDRRSVHAWNGLGIYELVKDEGWLVLLESLKKLFNRDHISMAIKAFERTLEIDPAFHPGRYNLALAYRQARGADNWRRAAAELERLVAGSPEIGNGPLLLVLTYRDLGDLQAMERAIESLPETEGFPHSLRRLLLAYALMNGERATEASKAYWDGVEAIASDREALIYWHDIRPIAAPEEDAEYRGLDLERKKAYLKEFWRQLADQAFVAPEERIAEHYRRLDHAYRNFRIDVPERRHYSALAAYVPPWQTGFDDRGTIYLRHGPPDEVATYSGPEVERNMSWKYNRPDGEPLIFHFVSDEDVGDFKLVRRLSDAILANSTTMAGQTLFDPRAGNAGRILGVGGVALDANDARILAGQERALRDLYRSRGHLDPLYDRIALDLDAHLLDEEWAEIAQAVTVGTRTRSFQPPAEESLLYPVYAVPFQDPGGRTTVAFYYALPAAQVDVHALPDGRSAVDYRYQLIIDPAGGGSTVRDQDDVRLVTSSQLPREPGVMLPRVKRMDLPPGEYQYGLKVTDLNSGRAGTVQGSVAFQDFASRGLALSGIVLATAVTPAGDAGDPFVRWGRWRVVPLPSRVFRRSQPVYVYYEAYGLDADPSGARWRTTYELGAAEPERNVVARFFSALGERLTGGEERRGSTATSFERSEPGGVDPLLEFFSLDVSGSHLGDYVLTITIEDLVTGETTRRSVPLALVD